MLTKVNEENLPDSQVSISAKNLESTLHSDQSFIKDRVWAHCFSLSSTLLWYWVEDFLGMEFLKFHPKLHYHSVRGPKGLLCAGKRRRPNLPLGYGIMTNLWMRKCWSTSKVSFHISFLTQSHKISIFFSPSGTHRPISTLQCTQLIWSFVKKIVHLRDNN